MSWIVLLAGLALWIGAHHFGRIAPGMRKPMGEKGKGVVTLGLVASIVLIVIGYRWTPFVHVWQPPAFLTHLNNLAVLVAFFLFSPAPKKGRIASGILHPQLTALGIWSGAHLAVNGDLTAILTFGTLFLWSILTRRYIDAADGRPAPRPQGDWKWDGIGLAGAIVLVAIVGLIHGWIGPSPFG